MKTLVMVLVFSVIGNVAHANGIYDPEIAVIRDKFGAYIKQSEKNIAALTKLVGAYDRVNEAMSRVADAKKSLMTTGCPRDSKERLLDCLSKQRSVIAFLDLYTRTGAEVMPKAIADAKEAGRILNQDVSGHLVKFEKADRGFKTWCTKTIPALKARAEHDREALTAMYGESLKADYKATAFLEESRHEAALLAEELTQAAVRLREQGMGWLTQHRMAHAKVTVASIQWLANKVPTMWTALEPAIQKEPKVEELKNKVVAVLVEQGKLLNAEIAKLNESTERLAGISLLKNQVEASALSEADRKAFISLFKEMSALAADKSKTAYADVLLERGYTWLEAMIK